MNVAYIIIVAAAVLLGAPIAFFALRRRAFRRAARPRPLIEALGKTNTSVGSRLANLFTRCCTLDDAFMAELEETLISADVSEAACARLLAGVRATATPADARSRLHSDMVALFTALPRPDECEPLPRVIMVMGVNGVGKTTSIAKLAYRYQRRGKRVLLAAADTFRAAATEQLMVWGSRLGCDVVSQDIGADAASVAFDAVCKAKARGHDIVLIDTAGRLHTKSNLMEELKKIDRVVSKAERSAPHDRWLVLDAAVGQNGLVQAREFHGALGLSGIIMTKLDGTARGGIVCSVAEMGIPVIAIGVGEGMDDLRPFEPSQFVDALLGIGS